MSGTGQRVWAAESKAQPDRRIEGFAPVAARCDERRQRIVVVVQARARHVLTDDADLRGFALLGLEPSADLGHPSRQLFDQQLH